MRRSEDEQREVPQLVDENEHARNFTEMKEAFLDKCFSFEDLLQFMGLPRPGWENKVSLTDFERAVVLACGSNRFSSF